MAGAQCRAVGADLHQTDAAPRVPGPRRARTGRRRGCARPVAAASAARSTVCGVPNTRSKAPACSGAPCSSRPKIPPPPSLSTTTSRSGTRLVRADHEARGVVQQGQVAEQRVRRSRMGEGRADGGRHGPVDPRDAPVGEHRDVPARDRGERHVADRVRRADDEQRAAGQGVDERPGQAQTARRARGVERGVERLGRGPVGVEPARRPAARAGSTTARRRPRGRSRRRRSSCRPCGSARAYTATRRVGEQPLHRPVQGRAARRRSPAAGRSASGERAEQPRSGAQADVPHTGRRFGDHRQPPPAHLRRGPGPGDDQRRALPGSSGSGSAWTRGRGTPRSTVPPPEPAGRGAFRRRAPAAPRTAGSGAPGRAACRARPPATRATAAPPRPVLPLGSLAGAAVSASRTASPKIPGWTTVWFAPVPSSCGGRSAVSTSSGTPGVRRLQHGRVQVRDRGARRRHHRHRPPGAQREAQREEAGGALVDADVQPQPVPRCRRRAARTRAVRCASRGRARRR